MNRTLTDLTAAELGTEVLRLAHANPNASYSNDEGVGSYSDGTFAGKPGDVFGQAFKNLNVADEDIDTEEFIATLLSHLPVHQQEVFTEVQQSQDSGVPLGEAVKPLEAMLAN